MNGIIFVLDQAGEALRRSLEEIAELRQALADAQAEIAELRAQQEADPS